MPAERLTSDRRIAAAADRWAHEHRDELIRDLIGLINIRSVARYDEEFPTGTGCRTALCHLEELAQQYGFQTENDGFCLSALLPGRTPVRELGLLGHLDVVPEGEGWAYDPFSAIEKNGYVIGRGAMDNKGPVVMALYVLRCMRELGIQLDSSVRLIAGSDEEKEMRDVQHYLQHHKPPAFTLNCDGSWAVGIGEKGILTADLTLPLMDQCLIGIGGGESSNMVPASAWAELRGVDAKRLASLCQATPGMTAETHKGSVRLCMSGRAAHCSMPRNGENAIRSLLQALCRSGLVAGETNHALKTLLQLIKDDEGVGLGIHYADRLSGSTTSTASLLSMQLGVLRLHINVRFAVTQPPDQLIQRLRNRCDALGAGIENLHLLPPRYTDPAQPEIRLLLDTCHEFLEKRHQLYMTGGGTHSRLFPHSVPFGPFSAGRPLPGNLGGPHAANEAVCVEDLLQAIKVYVAALIRLDRLFAKTT